jgi:hypothetical protein
VCFTILVLPVLLDEKYWSFQYCVLYNTSITSVDLCTIPEAPVFFIKNTGNTSIVKHTILEAPIFFIQQYW